MNSAPAADPGSANEIPTPGPHGWSCLAKLALLTLTLLIGFICLEVCLWLFAPKPLDPTLEEQLESAIQNRYHFEKQSTAMKMFDPLFHHSTFPHSRFSGELEGEGYITSINAQGFRGPGDFTEARAADMFRIAVLGDSFTFGLYVSDLEIWTARLAHHLKFDGERAPGGRRWEIQNFASVSYSPLIYWQLYRYKVKKYKPDLLLIAMDNSDLQDDYYYEKDAIFDERGDLKAFHDVHYSFFMGQVRTIGTPQERVEAIQRKLASPRERFYGWAKSRLQTGAHVRDFVDRNRFRPGDIDSDRLGHLREGVDWSAHWERTSKYLEKVIKLARADGVKVAILYYPYPHQVNGMDWSGRKSMGFKLGRTYDTPMREWLKSFAHSRDISFFDATQAFRDAGLSRFTYEGDPHYLPNGHDFLGKWLSQELPKKLQ
jgi:hypothetical protein